jgi:hypothetical protein
MKIFISWSGKLSHQIAKELKEWFPLVINQLEPFVSSENIKKGDRWMMDIYSELEQSNFGVICLTKENLTEPWILFEAGALSKNISQSRVSSILFDSLKQSDVKSPLSLFQNTEFTKEELKKLVQSINEALGDKKISETLLNRSFNKWYPELEEKINTIQEEYSPDVPKKQEGDNKINEILRTTKYISNVVSRFNLKLPTDTLDFLRFSNEQELEYATNGNNHPIFVHVNPINDSDGILKHITISSKGIDISPSKGATGRGVLIEILFYSEHDVFWTLSFHFHKGDTYVTTRITDIPVEEAEKLRHETIWRD